MIGPLAPKTTDSDRYVAPSRANVLSRVAASALAAATLASAGFVVALILKQVGASDFQQGVGATAFAFWCPDLLAFLNKHAER